MIFFRFLKLALILARKVLEYLASSSLPQEDSFFRILLRSMGAEILSKKGKNLLGFPHVKAGKTFLPPCEATPIHRILR